MLLKLTRRWTREKEATTAVEFALVALPFIIMIIGTVEMALMFTAQSLLEAGTATASRMIRTGQIQQSGGDQQQMFEDTLCGFVEVIIPCEEIQYNVVNLPNFGDAADMPDAEFDEDGNMEDQGFDPGNANDVVLIRVSYTYPIVTPMMQPVLTNTSDHNTIMLSTVVLQTEPYEFEEE